MKVLWDESAQGSEGAQLKQAGGQENLRRNRARIVDSSVELTCNSYIHIPLL